MNTILAINHFCKIYDNRKVAAQDINIKVNGGDIFAFIGHNGAGKTTTIKCIAGISSITKGDILINGHSIIKEPIKCKKMIAYVPDNPDIYNDLTGIQYLNLIADLFKMSKTERTKNIDYYATIFTLKNELNLKISNYSHGMRQKLVLIGSLMHNPKLLLLDEPFVGLDPKASFDLKTIMNDFVKNGGAIFFSTHVLDVAEKLCNKVAIIKNGKIIMQGTMEEVKNNNSLENVFLQTNNA